jgi:hypothetical protein
MHRTERGPHAALPTGTPSTKTKLGSRRKRSLYAAGIAAGVMGFVVAGCGSDGNGGSQPAGAGNVAGARSTVGGSNGVAGAPAIGGAVGSSGAAAGGAAGQIGSAGAADGRAGGGSGGQPGIAGMGGHASGSAGSSSSGGSTSSGGTTGSGGRGGGASAGSSSGGAGSCQKGQTKPAEVVIMGESFYAISPQYNQKRIQEDARKAGSLGANDTYRNVAVSGQNMNYIATTEWTAATQGNASVKVVIMDGGGIDCLTGGSTCSTCAATFKTLLGKMATAGVQDVIYTRYPEPGAPPGSDAGLKACLDSTMPGMQTACEGSTAPRCHWVDLRPVFVAGDTTDGLHPTQSGGEHVGDLIWSEMVKLCLAQ